MITDDEDDDADDEEGSGDELITPMYTGGRGSHPGSQSSGGPHQYTRGGGGGHRTPSDGCLDEEDCLEGSGSRGGEDHYTGGYPHHGSTSSVGSHDFNSVPTYTPLTPPPVMYSPFEPDHTGSESGGEGHKEGDESWRGTTSIHRVLAPPTIPSYYNPNRAVIPTRSPAQVPRPSGPPILYTVPLPHIPTSSPTPPSSHSGMGGSGGGGSRPGLHPHHKHLPTHHIAPASADRTIVLIGAIAFILLALLILAPMLFYLRYRYSSLSRPLMKMPDDELAALATLRRSASKGHAGGLGGGGQGGFPFGQISGTPAPVLAMSASQSTMLRTGGPPPGSVGPPIFVGGVVPNPLAHLQQHQQLPDLTQQFNHPNQQQLNQQLLNSQTTGLKQSASTLSKNTRGHEWYV